MDENIHPQATAAVVNNADDQSIKPGEASISEALMHCGHPMTVVGKTLDGSQNPDENTKPAIEGAETCEICEQSQYMLETEEASSADPEDNPTLLNPLSPSSDQRAHFGNDVESFADPEDDPPLSNPLSPSDDQRAHFESGFQMSNPVINPTPAMFQLSSPPTRLQRAMRKLTSKGDRADRLTFAAGSKHKGKEYMRAMSEWSLSQIESVKLQPVEPEWTFKSPPSKPKEQSQSDFESCPGFFLLEPFVPPMTIMPNSDRVTSGRLDSDRRQKPSLEQLGRPPLTAEELIVPKMPVPGPSPDSLTALWNRRLTRIYSHPNNPHPLSFQLEPRSPSDLADDEMLCPLYLEQPGDREKRQHLPAARLWSSPKQTIFGVQYQDYVQERQSSAGAANDPHMRMSSPSSSKVGEGPASLPETVIHLSGRAGSQVQRGLGDSDWHSALSNVARDELKLGKEANLKEGALRGKALKENDLTAQVLQEKTLKETSLKGKERKENIPVRLQSQPTLAVGTTYSSMAPRRKYSSWTPAPWKVREKTQDKGVQVNMEPRAEALLELRRMAKDDPDKFQEEVERCMSEAEEQDLTPRVQKKAWEFVDTEEIPNLEL